MSEEIRVYLQKGKLVVNGFTDANTLRNIVNVLTIDDRVERAIGQTIRKPGKKHISVSAPSVVVVRKTKKPKKNRRSNLQRMTWGGKPTVTARVLSFLQNKHRAGYTKIKVIDVFSQGGFVNSGSTYESISNAALKLGYKVGKEGRHRCVYFDASPSEAIHRSVMGRPKIVTDDIAKYIRKYKKRSIRKISNMITKRFGVYIAPNTVNNFMRRHGIGKRRADLNYKPSCIYCGSDDVRNKGARILKKGGRRRRFQCHKCGSQFSENVLAGKVRVWGNSGGILLPRSLLGKKVKVVLDEKDI